MTPNSAIDTAVDDLESISIPKDGEWDNIAAHEKRFCFQRGEDEWLLETADRWMLSSDFDVSGVQTKLEAKLQKYEPKRYY
jgi:hypothetical protein